MAKGFLAEFISKKLTLQKMSVKGNDPSDSYDGLATARYRSALMCLARNSRQDLKEILRLSPPHMSERQATEEFLKNLSCAAEEFAKEFAQAIEALAQIVIWKDGRNLEQFPVQLVPELDSAINEIFPDAATWGNIAWDGILKHSERILSDKANDVILLAIYSRAGTILASNDNKVAKQYFETFRADVMKAIVINIIQPMAHSIGNEMPLDENRKQMLLDMLSLLQTTLLAA